MENRQQTEWIRDLLKRTKVDLDSQVTGILDTGINNGHPLLAPVLKMKTVCL